MGLLTSRQILELLHAGDERGLSALFEQVAPKVKGSMKSRLGVLSTDTELDDAIQFALGKVWLKARKIRDPAHLAPYFAKIAINRCKRLLRKRGPRPEFVGDLLGLLVAPEPGEAVLDPGVAEIARRLQRLPKLELDILRSDTVAIRPAKQLAHELGTTPASVDSLRYRTRRRIGTWMQELGMAPRGSDPIRVGRRVAGAADSPVYPEGENV